MVLWKRTDGWIQRKEDDRYDVARPRIQSRKRIIERFGPGEEFRLRAYGVGEWRSSAMRMFSEERRNYIRRSSYKSKSPCIAKVIIHHRHEKLYNQ